MVVGEAHRPRVCRQVFQTQRSRVIDEASQDSFALRELADARDGRLVHADVHEADELPVTHDAERGVPRRDQRLRALGDALDELVELESGGNLGDGVEQTAESS
ncbi:hypothetical protein PHK61_29310 [Actinomycetospora lutea]|uniref:hypothetical protein n=1 Tax=Actinomycetospora lutea TaxID=663604 RepID=UPI002366C856|nr:hypothetical protein [Actinomycetospora lutea]MDD7942518.1 hypothetical protein [Actinomycetospora lutea]